MLIAHYAHRLPADYDLDVIRQRARERGPLWDRTPDLHFKCFLLRAAGRHGATANSYASLYLWRHDDALRAFLTDGRYRVVTDSFGRAPIDVRVALDARRGPATQARFAAIEEVAIGPDADLTRVLADEAGRNREAARRDGVVAAAVGVDTRQWRLTRVCLSEHEPSRDAPGTVHEILHLAAPLLHLLDPAGG